MRVVFPTDENMGYSSERGAHFESAKYYTVISLDEEKIVKVECIQNPAPYGAGCGDAVFYIMALKPDAMVVNGIGGLPAEGFSKVGLTLYVDRVNPTIEKSVQMLVAGELEKVGGKGMYSVH